MADTTTPLLQLVDQENGGNTNTWGDIADANFLKLENAITGITTIASNSASITLTDDQMRSMFLQLTGVLTANQTIIVPARQKLFIFQNATSGAFITTVKTAAGVGVVPPQNQRPTFLFSDATGVGTIDTQPAAEIGTIKMHGAATAPAGYLLCDFSAVSRTTYAALFAVIGTTFGVGDGSTTFNLPDFRSRRPVGVGTGVPSLSLYTLGLKSGTETFSLATGNLPAHNHGISDPGHIHNVSDPGHIHNNTGGSNPVGTGTIYAGQSGNSFAIGVNVTAVTGISIAAAATGISTTNTGSGTAVTKVDPTLAVNFIIRAY